jgi:hypothetical protein
LRHHEAHFRYLVDRCTNEGQPICQALLRPQWQGSQRIRTDVEFTGERIFAEVNAFDIRRLPVEFRVEDGIPRAPRSLPLLAREAARSRLLDLANSCPGRDLRSAAMRCVDCKSSIDAESPANRVNVGVASRTRKHD